MPIKHANKGALRSVVRARDFIKPATYGSGDIAARIGRSSDWFYRHKELLYAAGMPRPLAMPGYPCWNKAQIEAWLNGWLGALQQTANDQAAAAAPAADDRNVEEWRDHLARRYRRA